MELGINNLGTSHIEGSCHQRHFLKLFFIFRLLLLILRSTWTESSPCSLSVCALVIVSVGFEFEPAAACIQASGADNLEIQKFNILDFVQLSQSSLPVI